MKLLLFTGDRQYSSWSMRARVALLEKEVPFEEISVPLEYHVRITPQGVVDAPQTRPEPATGCMCDRSQLLWADPTNILRACFVSSTSRLPVLLNADKRFAVTDSIAIAEYAESLNHDAEVKLFPEDLHERARVLSFAMHIHSDFLRLYEEMSYPRSFREESLADVSVEARNLANELIAELNQVLAAKTSSDAQYLFGSFSLADVEMSPVAQSFRGWRLDRECPPLVQRYLDVLLARPSVSAHLADAFQLYGAREGFPVGSPAWIAHHYRFHDQFRILHNFRSNICHRIETDSAWDMFQLARGGLDEKGISQQIAEEYCVDQSEALADTRAFFSAIDPRRDVEYCDRPFAF